MARAILHLDMDAFYASVEQRDRPELRGLPVVVGGRPEARGVVCAASYEARRFGVRSAMPTRTAARLCPQAVFLPVRMQQYQAESRAIFALVAGLGAVVEQISVDEAYLDVSSNVGLASADGGGAFDECAEAAAALGAGLKSAITQARGLTASVGVASNKLLAKIASDHRKPDGLTVILDRERRAFLRPLPCRTLYGVGPVTAANLARAGIHTIGDLQDYAGDLSAFTGSFGSVLRRFAEGEDDRPLEVGGEARALGSETTFDRDTVDRAELRATLWSQATALARRLSNQGLVARTVQVKVRYGDFTTRTRQLSVEAPVADAREIYRLAAWLMGQRRLADRPLRLLGISVSRLEATPQAVQLTLGWERVGDRSRV